MSRRRPPLTDLALAGILSLLGIVQLLAEGASVRAVVFLLAMTLPVALRRRHPVVAVGVGYLSLVVSGGFGEDVTSQGYAAILALWVTVYSAGRHGRGSERFVGLGLAWGLVVLSVVTSVGLDWPSMLLTSIITVAPWAAGYLVQREESRRAGAGEDPGRARDEAAKHAREAVLDERSRIASEVHDVLGHTLGLMVLQLGAAEQAMASDPERAREAVRSARAAGKSALAEVRYLIGLQDAGVAGGVDGDAQSAVGGSAAVPPTRGLRDIPGLVAQNRRAGVDVELEMLPGAMTSGW